MTEHLLGLGARRVGFVGLPDSAASVDLRQAGYREALEAAGLAVEPSLVRRLDPTDPAAVRRLLDEARPDALLAANDWTAARLLHTLLALGRAVPGDVRLAGIDDLPYAGLLPVPLTTLRQPTAQIGAAALAAMLDRVAAPAWPPATSSCTGRWWCAARAGPRARPRRRADLSPRRGSWGGARRCPSP